MSLLFTATSPATIKFPDSATKKILFLDLDGAFKVLSFNGEVTLLSSNDKQLVKETLVKVAGKGAVDDAQYLAIKKLLIQLEKKDTDIVAEINKLRIADEESKRNYQQLSKELREKTLALKAELLAKLPPETVVSAGKLTYGDKDELVVRYSDNVYFIDLQLKNKLPETKFVAGGGATKAWVEEYFQENKLDKTYITSTGGTVEVTPVAGGYNLEVPQQSATISISSDDSSIIVTQPVSGQFNLRVATIANNTNITSIDNSVIVTSVSAGQFDLSVSNSNKLDAYGSISLPIGIREQTVSYGFSAPTSAFLTVNVECLPTDPTPTGAVVNRSTESFTYKFAGRLQTSNYKLNYNIRDNNYSVSPDIYVLGTENGDILIDEYGNYLGI